MPLISEIQQVRSFADRRFSKPSSSYRVILLLVLLLMGCNSTTNGPELGSLATRPEQEGGVAKPEVAPKVSKVPLRIWVVGTLAQSDVLLRQWLAEDDQPAEIRVLTADELAEDQSIQADVLVYPTRLLGELISREAIVKLPDAIIDSNRAEISGSEARDSRQAASLSSLPGLISANSYDGFQYAMPLGYSTVSLIGSSATNAEEMNYDALAARVTELSAGGPASGGKVAPSEIDSDALVDRFLSIAFGKSLVNSKYGVLFEVRSMRARLTQPEFVFAADLLVKLASQRDSLASVLGSHSVSWTWVNESDSERYALASASQLDSTSRTLDRGRWIRIPNAKNWNSGSGLGASISAQCRQTAQSIRFLKWLSQSRTIASVESSLQGTVSLAATASQLAHRVNRQVLPCFSDYNLSCEPRLPGVESYRKALAEELISIIQGASSVPEGLSAAAKRWDEITDRQALDQKREYERSLGMTL